MIKQAIQETTAETLLDELDELEDDFDNVFWELERAVKATNEKKATTKRARELVWPLECAAQSLQRHAERIAEIVDDLDDDESGDWLDD